MGGLIYVLGYLLIILAAVLQAYCEFGRQARDSVKPHVFTTRFRYVLEGIWILLRHKIRTKFLPL